MAAYPTATTIRLDRARREDMAAAAAKVEEAPTEVKE
jgi:hypothetical protein